MSYFSWKKNGTETPNIEEEGACETPRKATILAQGLVSIEH